MEINWKPGKTEVILVLRGRNAAQEKLRVKSVDDKRFLEVLVSTDDSTPKVHVVSEYKHVGSIGCESTAWRLKRGTAFQLP